MLVEEIKLTGLGFCSPPHTPIVFSWCMSMPTSLFYIVLFLGKHDKNPVCWICPPTCLACFASFRNWHVYVKGAFPDWISWPWKVAVFVFHMVGLFLLVVFVLHWLVGTEQAAKFIVYRRAAGLGRVKGRLAFLAVEARKTNYRGIKGHRAQSALGLRKMSVNLACRNVDDSDN